MKNEHAEKVKHSFGEKTVPTEANIGKVSDANSDARDVMYQEILREVMQIKKA